MDKQLKLQKHINSRCSCGNGLNWTSDQIVMIEPCEHLVHLKCINKKKNECMICNEEYTEYLTESDLKHLKDIPEYYQKYVDLISMKSINDLTEYNNAYVITNIPNLLGVGLSLPFTRGFDTGHDVCKNMLCSLNAIVKVNGRHNIKKGKKIIIANHTTYCDFIILFFLFKCGFLSSTAIKDSPIGRLLINIIPLLLIDRGNKQNTVTRIKEYVEEHEMLCLFPEGIMTHPDTIINFRTGAFHVGYSICPVIIRYDPVIADSNILSFIRKAISYDKFKIIIDILPTETFPFSEAKIEKIRNDMGKTGNMALSRVSNRDIKEEKIEKK